MENFMKPDISIAKICDQAKASSALLSQAEWNRQEVQHLAFDHFQGRGQTTGRDDWLRAEREVLWKPQAEMVQNRRAVVLRVAVPGFGPKSIQVMATPDCIVIQGTETHSHAGLDARLAFCEFGQRLFRRFDLSVHIDPNTVSATLDQGILEIFASIARPPQNPENHSAGPPAECAAAE